MEDILGKGGGGMKSNLKLKFNTLSDWGCDGDLRQSWTTNKLKAINVAIKGERKAQWAGLSLALPPSLSLSLSLGTPCDTL